VKESRDRVSTALTNSGFRFPMGRTTINLAPADVVNGIEPKNAQKKIEAQAQK